MALNTFKSYEDTAASVRLYGDKQAGVAPTIKMRTGWSKTLAVMTEQEMADYLRLKKIWSVNGAIKHFESQVSQRAVGSTPVIKPYKVA
jgi:hypothetical protein